MGYNSKAYRAVADMSARLGIAAGARDCAVAVFMMEERKGKAHHYYTKGRGEERRRAIRDVPLCGVPPRGRSPDIQGAGGGDA
jgi:hypothetical protein